jgi:hypothetical protein
MRALPDAAKGMISGEMPAWRTSGAEAPTDPMRFLSRLTCISHGQIDAV